MVKILLARANIEAQPIPLTARLARDTYNLMASYQSGFRTHDALRAESS